MPKQRLALFNLAFAQCFGSAAQITMATLSALVGAALAPAPKLATLPVTIGILGIALATLPVASMCRRYGRRPVFIGAALWGALGATLATVAILRSSFAGFCFGCFVMGNNIAVVAQYRFAVAEFVPGARISRAVAGLMLGTLLAAAATPWIAMRTRNLLPAEFAGSYAALPLLYLTAAVILLFVPLGRPHDDTTQPVRIPSLRGILARPAIQLAIVSAAVSYGAMSLIMTATPISMHVMDHHSVEATAGVIRSHLLAMFIPSLFSGWLIARMGIGRMLWLGVLVNAGCVMLSVSGQEVWQYRSAMIALGIGWNLLFVAGTTLLATACNRDEVLRIQGINDFMMFATMATASLSAGALLDGIGWVWTNLVALGLLVLVVIALLRTRRSGYCSVNPVPGK